jgi:eukaryotic-like serine/threonine-protein kinase
VEDAVASGKNVVMYDGQRRLSGRYELREIIGRGGMGTVYRATDLVLDRTVAVKVLPAALAEEDSRHIVRFQREARAAASLAHPSVVAIYDSGEDEDTRFIVMECVAGRSLSQVLRADAPLPPARAATIGAGVADALAAAHAAGIVHRDVKPGNVMLQADDAVKVLDFGLARSLGGSALTQTAAVLGTAHYMAPEQALGHPADERSDIYSLGCVLYALLTGRPPFTGEAAAAILHQHVNSDPPPPSALNPGVSKELEETVMQMLAKSPAARPRTATQVRDRLTALAAAPRAAAGLPPTAVAARTERVQPTAATRVLGVGPGGRRRRRVAAGAGLAAAAMLIAAIIALASGGGTHHTPGARTVTTAAKGTLAATAARKPAPVRTQTSAASAPPPQTAATTSVHSAPSPPLSVAAAAAALGSLLAQDVRSGTIDQRAADLLGGGLADIANSYPDHPLEARNAALALSQRLTTLQEHGHVAAAGAGALSSALATLGAALGSSATPPTPGQGAPSEPEAVPPGHGGGKGGHGKQHGD